MCDVLIKNKLRSRLGRSAGSRVHLSATSMTQHYFMNMHYMLSSCLTQICEAGICGSAAADCCSSKAVYWPRPTLMLHPSNAAAAWPTFLACHTVGTVPGSGRKALRAAYGQAAAGRLMYQFHQWHMQHRQSHSKWECHNLGLRMSLKSGQEATLTHGRLLQSHTNYSNIKHEISLLFPQVTITVDIVITVMIKVL